MEKPCQEDLSKVYLGNKITTTKQSTYIHINRRSREKKINKLCNTSLIFSFAIKLFITDKENSLSVKENEEHRNDGFSFF